MDGTNKARIGSSIIFKRFNIIYFLIMCLFPYVGMCMLVQVLWNWRYKWMEPPDIGAGNPLRSSGRASCAPLSQLSRP